MSDILTGIKQRLSTDIGDLARASIDPTFSRQLTEANFRDKAFQKERKAALEDAAKLRTQQVADQQRKERVAIHMKLVEDGITAIKEQGNNGPLIRILESEGLDPVAREWAVRSVNAHLPQGLAGIEKQAQIKNIKSQMTTRQKRLVLDQQKAKDQVAQALQDDLREDEKFAYNQAVDMMNQEQSIINRDSYLNHIEQNAFMFTPEEIKAARETFKFGDEDTVKKYWENLWGRVFTRNLEAGKDRRSAEQAGQKPAGLTGGEITEATVFLGPVLDKAIENDGELEDYLDDDFIDLWWGKDKAVVKQNRGRAIIGAARIAKTLGRNLTDAADPFFKDAFKLILLTGQTEINGEKIIDPNPASSLASDLAALQLTDSRFTLKALNTKIEQNPNNTPEEALADMKRLAGIQ